jgi:diguanylate cyclase (GGDEF)-like protein/PAS domain S-box-containing protein
MSKILIVDDNEANRYLLVKLLKSEGYEIITADNGEHALEIYSEQAPDLIITDMNMPVMDGFELAETIRKDANSAHIPIIFISAMYRDMVSKVKAMDIGGNEYLTLPVDHDELNYKVKAMLRNKNLYDELLRSREAMQESELKYRTLFNNATDAIYLIDIHTQQILDCNLKASEVTGYSATELKTMTIGDLHPGSEQDIVKKIFRKMKKTGAFSDITGINQLSKDGRLVPIEINAATFNMGGRIFGLGIFRDITERKKTEALLLQEKNNLVSILDTMEDGVYIVNKEYDIEYVNPVLRKTFGAVIGDKCYKHFHNTPKVCPMCKNKDIFEGNSVRWEWLSQKSSRVYDIIETPIAGPEGGISKLAILRDITERKKIEAKLREAAVTDDLTGLFNRRGFTTISEKQLNLAKRHERRLALLYLDLDNLKLINDKLGHKEGDRALRDFANLLKKSFRESDIIARIGGDEFAVLLTEMTDSADMAIDHLKDNIKRMNDRISRTYPLSVSIGFAFYNPGMKVSIDKLISLADAAMYEEKKSKKIESPVIPIEAARGEEKRSFERFFAGDECSASFNGSGKIRVKDISLGGICLKSHKKMAPNSIYEITILSPEKEKIAHSGMVIWSSRYKTKSNEHKSAHYYETGLKFIGLNELSRSSLDKFIADIIK